MGSLWTFFYYSFLGFLLELAFARWTGSAKPDRKCFFLLPLCPVYGLGALGVLALPPAIADRWPLLWLLGGGICTLAEYGMGLFYAKALGVNFWSYKARRGNVGGYVCPQFALVWGGLAVALRRWLHPAAAPALAAIPQSWLLPAVVALTLDSYATLALLTARRDTACLRWYDACRLRAFPAPGWCRPAAAGAETRPPER